MALSGSVTTSYWVEDSGATRGYTLSWSASQSIANNQSTISWTLSTAGSYAYQVAERTLYVVIAGNVVVNKTDRVMRGAGTVASGSFTVNHASDGTFGFSVSIQAAVYTSAVNCTGSGSFTLNQIPRQANITSAINVTDEQNPYFTFNNPGGFDLTAALEVNPNNTHLFSRTISNTGSYTFELSESERETLRSYLVNAKSGTLRYLLYSNGGQFVSYADRTLTIVNADPTLEVTVEDENDATLELTGDSNKIIEGYSDAVTNASYSALKGASISSYKVVNGSKTLTTAPATFEGVSSGSFVFSVTDSRGNTTTKTVNLETVGYIKLTCDLDVKAPNAEGEMDFTVSGNCFNGSFGNAENTIQVYYRYKMNDEEYGEWIETGVVLNDDNTYRAEVSLTALNYLNRYTFQAMAVDLLSSVESVEKTVKTTPVFDWGENDFNFNVPVTIQGMNVKDTVTELNSKLQTCDLLLKAAEGTHDIPSINSYKFITLQFQLYDWGNIYAFKTVPVPYILQNLNFDFIIEGNDGIVLIRFLNSTQVEITNSSVEHFTQLKICGIK